MARHSEKCGFQICVQWQEIPIVETLRADKATRNADDSVAKRQERTATVPDVGLQTVEGMH
jgi:hypothetical protein